MFKNNLFLILSTLSIGALVFYAFNARKHKCHDCHHHHDEAPAAASVERTFAIIKPDAVVAGKTEEIIKAIQDNGFTIVEKKELTFDKDAAEVFYAEHKEKPFFADLVTYITSGPAVVLVLEKENAVHAWRDLMGSTNPANAQEGTLRKQFGTNIQRNAVHGSDSVESAKREIAQFFPAA